MRPRIETRVKTADGPSRGAELVAVYFASVADLASQTTSSCVAAGFAQVIRRERLVRPSRIAKALRYATTPNAMAAELVLAPQDDGSATPALARSRRRA